MSEDFQTLVQRQHWALQQEFKQLEDRAAARYAQPRAEFEAYTATQRSAAAKASAKLGRTCPTQLVAPIEMSAVVLCRQLHKIRVVLRV